MGTQRWRRGGEVAKDGDKIVYTNNIPSDDRWRAAGEWTDDNRLVTPPRELGTALVEGARKR